MDSISTTESHSSQLPFGRGTRNHRLRPASPGVDRKVVLPTTPRSSEHDAVATGGGIDATTGETGAPQPLPSSLDGAARSPGVPKAARCRVRTARTLADAALRQLRRTRRDQREPRSNDSARRDFSPARPARGPRAARAPASPRASCSSRCRYSSRDGGQVGGTDRDVGWLASADMAGSVVAALCILARSTHRLGAGSDLCGARDRCRRRPGVDRDAWPGCAADGARGRRVWRRARPVHGIRRTLPVGGIRNGSSASIPSRGSVCRSRTVPVPRLLAARGRRSVRVICRNGRREHAAGRAFRRRRWFARRPARRLGAALASGASRSPHNYLFPRAGGDRATSSGSARGRN